jgi:hypothetical protein
MPLLHYNSRAANGSLFTPQVEKSKGSSRCTNFRVAKQLDLLNQEEWAKLAMQHMQRLGKRHCSCAVTPGGRCWDNYQMKSLGLRLIKIIL